MAIAASYPALRPSLLLDFANAKAVDPRVTFVRSTTGKFYDGVTTAKAEENLLLQSQTFNTTWAATSATVTADTTVAPDGTTTADTVTASAGTVLPRVSQTTVAFLGDTVFSFYAKAGTYGFVQAYSGYGTGYFANFDLSSGVVGTKGASCSASSIENVGGGWYRCVATFLNVDDIVISLAASASATYGQSWSALGTETVIIWGAQLEQRSAVTAYTPTTTQPITNYIPVLQTAAAGVPRIDHDPVTGECLGLLIEEQRTNLLTYSEDFGNAAWGKDNTTILANTIVAPDGTLTGEKLSEDTNTGLHNVSNSTSLTSGTSYTASYFVKKAERSKVQLRRGSAAALPPPPTALVFDLNTGTFSGSLASGWTSPFITSVGNGWYRIGITVVPTSTNSDAVGLYICDDSGNQSYTGDGYSGIYIWGAQLEAGAFPTSYIPTTSTQETRNADAASMTGTNFSSWYNAGEGTVYYEGDRLIATSSQISLSDGTNSNWMRLYSSGTDTLQYATGVLGGATQWDVGRSSVSSAVAFKQSFAYESNNIGFVLNGGAVANDSVANIPSVDRMLLCQSAIGGAQQQRQHIKKLAYYPQRLTNANLQALTA